MTNSPYYFRVELRQLEAFVAVATDLHFGKAAERMFISQPTLSEHMKVLVQAGLVRSKRIKQWTFYRRDDAHIAAVKQAITETV